MNNSKWTLEDLLSDESFLNYYFNKNQNDVLDWEDWKGEDPQREKVIHEAFEYLDKLSLKLDETQIIERYKTLQSRIEYLKVESEVNRNNFWMKRVQRIAAVFIVLASVVSLIYYNLPSHDFQNIPKSIANKNQVTIENKEIAKIRVITLRDGSVIRMNSGTTISFSDQYSYKNRDIHLDGEAYFEVAKDKQLPFRVYAKNSVTTAIGTAFSVRSYNNDKIVKVVLVEGKVEVKNKLSKTAPVKLLQGQQIKVVEENILPIESLRDAAAEVRWKDGYIMNFRENKLSDVISTLAAQYKTPIIGLDHTELANEVITAEFDKSTHINQIMEALAFSNNFGYTIKNDSIFIITK